MGHTPDLPAAGPTAAPVPSDAPPAASRQPAPGWRARLGWPALALAVLAFGPLLVCMPLTLDTIHYDTAAYILLRGGVLYRDSFDTNLPGPTWIHTVFRGLAGFRSEALRLLDLAILGGIIALLLGWARQAGRTLAELGWAALLLFLLYSSRTEWCHCQRDTWMLLPALAALALRRGQVLRLRDPASTARVRWAYGMLEGLLWGAAFWIKPFVALPAAACWVTGALLARDPAAPPGRLGRRLAADVLALLAGGLLAGLPGVLWLRDTGAWDAFWDIVLHWNREYYAGVTLAARVRQWPGVAGSFFPWSVLLGVALVASVVLLKRAASPAPPDGRRLLALPAALLLGWCVQAYLLQRPFYYVLLPTFLIALGLVAALPLSRPARRAAPWVVAVFVVLGLGLHPLAVPRRAAMWPRCWKEGASQEVRTRLTQDPELADPPALARVRDWLQGRVGDRELTCYDPSTLPLYIDLNVLPSTRYLYLLNNLLIFKQQVPRMRRELDECPQRYVVTDTEFITLPPEALAALPPDGECVPPRRALAPYAAEYPWSLPIVYRSGRFLVHQVEKAGGPE